MAADVVRIAIKMRPFPCPVFGMCARRVLQTNTHAANNFQRFLGIIKVYSVFMQMPSSSGVRSRTGGHETPIRLTYPTHAPNGQPFPSRAEKISRDAHSLSE